MSTSHSVPAAAAGIVFQFERALFHLAKNGRGSIIGIETSDDVAVQTADGKKTWEQDKLSFQTSGHPLTDKSKNLWNTFLIWLKQLGGVPKTQPAIQLNLVTNRPVPDCLAKRISQATTDEEVKLCIEELKKTGTSEQEDIQAIMDKVLSYTDEELGRLVRAVTLYDGGTGTAGIDLYNQLIDALDLPNGLPSDTIAQSLAGWLKDTVMECWSNQLPALITHESFNTRKYELIRQIQRSRVLARAEHEVIADKDEHEKSKASNFVNHLLLINHEEDGILEAINDFIRFNSERSRLLLEGEISSSDWDALFNELRRRWKPILNRVKRNRGTRTAEEAGQEILFDTVESDFYATLAGSQVTHKYFTSGAYHRLANEDLVWWHPEFK